MAFLIVDEFHTPHWSLAPFTVVSKGGGAGGSPGEAFSPTSRAGVFFFFFFLLQVLRAYAA